MDETLKKPNGFIYGRKNPGRPWKGEVEEEVEKENNVKEKRAVARKLKGLYSGKLSETWLKQ